MFVSFDIEPIEICFTRDTCLVFTAADAYLVSLNVQTAWLINGL